MLQLQGSLFLPPTGSCFLAGLEDAFLGTCIQTKTRFPIRESFCIFLNYLLNADLSCLPLASQIIAATMAWNSDPCFLSSAKSLCSVWLRFGSASPHHSLESVPRLKVGLNMAPTSCISIFLKVTHKHCLLFST